MNTKYKDITLKELVNYLMEDLKIDAELYDKESIQQQIRRTAKKLPIKGEGSFFNMAKKNGKKYSEEAVNTIIRHNENYLSARSSDPAIQQGGFFKDIRMRREQINNSLKESELINSLKENYSYSLESSVIPFCDIYSSFKDEYSRPPIDTIEFTDFIDRYKEMNFIDVTINEGGSVELYDIPAPPISEEELALLNSDYHYEPIYQMEDECNPDSEKIIIGKKKRSYSETLDHLPNIENEMMIRALYELFFNPIKRDELREDLYISFADYPEHKRLDIYSDACERLDNYHNYCTKKKSPILENTDYKYFENHFRKINNGINKWGD